MKNPTPEEPTSSLSPFWAERQPAFVSMLSELAPSPSDAHVRLAMLLEAAGIESSVPSRPGPGRPPRYRRAIARALLAKAFLGLPHTKALVRALRSDEALRALCGFWKQVPSESAFSRAFASFAKAGLGDLALDRLVEAHFSQATVFHVSRDSSAIPARESRPPRKARVPKAKGRPGRKRGVPRALRPQEAQIAQDAEASLREIPTHADVGAKLNSKGHPDYWFGYKLHVDVSDEGFPLLAKTTSASVHDSRLAIPMMKLVTRRAGRILYQLMDAAYASRDVHDQAGRLGQVAIVGAKGTRGHPAAPLDPDRALRYRNRTAVERCFSDLKDNRGGNSVRVKGHAKVHLHLLLGLVSIFAHKILTRA